METIHELFLQIKGLLTAIGINLNYVGLFILAGYLQGTYLTHVKKIGPVWKTFWLGSLFSVVYVFLQREPGNKQTWVEFFASYLFATSLYEMFIKDVATLVINKVRNIVKKKVETPE